MWCVANLFQKWFGIIKQLLPMSEGDMTICSPSTGYIALGLRPRAILPASGEQIVMSPSLKGNNCIIKPLRRNLWIPEVYYLNLLKVSFVSAMNLNEFRYILTRVHSIKTVYVLSH